MSSPSVVTRALYRSVVLAASIAAWPAWAAEIEAATPPVVTEPVASSAQPPAADAALTTASIAPSANLPADELAAPKAADDAPKPTVASADRIEILDECLDIDACIDRYLWALYERAPKLDKIKETERRIVTVKRKGRMVKVTRSFTRLVDNDFTWKDPKAAERVGLSMKDYVIGGMDRSFKLKLFHTLHAAEAAGLAPGITSAFRDDYRQEIASGLKAATNRSYHGGSLRGGYGHGLAADIVSVNGATRAQRWVATEQLWKWVDANGDRKSVV